MNRIIRITLYLLLLLLGLSATPAHLMNVSYDIAAVGLAAMLLLHLRSARSRLDYALAWVALWAVLAVLCAPLVPFWRALGDLAVGAL